MRQVESREDALARIATHICRKDEKAFLNPATCARRIELANKRGNPFVVGNGANLYWNCAGCEGPIPREKKGEMKTTKEYVCRHCGPLPADMFYPSKKDVCKQCHTGYKKKTAQKKMGALPSESKTEERREDTEMGNEAILTEESFKDYPELLSQLKDMARDEVRPLHMQILYYCKLCLGNQESK